MVEIQHNIYKNLNNTHAMLYAIIVYAKQDPYLAIESSTNFTMPCEVIVG